MRHARGRVRRPGVAAAKAAGYAVRWGGVLGALAVSVAVGAVCSHVWHRGLWPWVSLTLAGGFAIWITWEIRATPPPPDGES